MTTLDREGGNRKPASQRVRSSFHDPTASLHAVGVISPRGRFRGTPSPSRDPGDTRGRRLSTWAPRLLDDARSSCAGLSSRGCRTANPSTRRYALRLAPQGSLAERVNGSTASRVGVAATSAAEKAKRGWPEQV